MSVQMKTYDLGQVSVSFMGRILTGAAESQFVKVKPSEAAWSHHVGATGEECRSRTNNNSGDASVFLSQWSSDNAVLAALHLADKASPGAGVGVLLIADKSGSSIHSSETAYILEMPEAMYAKVPGDREWTFKAPGISNFIGGN